MIRYRHSVLVLRQMQDVLSQVVGDKGRYTYSKAMVLKTSQTVLIRDMDFSFQDHGHLKIHTLRIIPGTGMKIAKAVASGVIWQQGSYVLSIRDLYVYDLRFRKKPENRSYLLDDLLDSSFRQGEMNRTEVTFPEGKVRIAAIHARLMEKHELHGLSYQLSNIDYFSRQGTAISIVGDHTHVQRLMISIHDVQQDAIQVMALSDLLRRDKVTYDIEDLQFYDHAALPYLTGSGIRLDMMNGTKQLECQGQMDRMEYRLSEHKYAVNQFLQKLGYASLKGRWQFHFTYVPEQGVLTFQPLYYQGNDFISLNLIGQFYVHSKVDYGFPYELSLKTAHIRIADTGLKGRFLNERARQFRMDQKQVVDQIAHSLDSVEQGKDFYLDYQFYKALAKIMRNPDQQMLITMAFPQGEAMSSLMTVNFLDLFKLANKGNMQFMAVQKK